ncbi:hypothetical protein BS78_10G276800 [Paspalum vaginatum]|nr:hypothetical protein BS78_10G276800 [Paspalum vaginatum]
MGVSRRFLNLLVPGSSPGIKSLFRLNLARQQLFHPDPDAESPSPGVPVPSLNNKKKKEEEKEMDMIRLSGPPSYTLRASDHAWKMDCFPLTDSNLICTDQSGLGFFLDAGTRKVATMPPLLHKPRGAPISVLVPKPKPDVIISRFGEDKSSSSLLLLMERSPQPEPPVIGGDGGVQQESEQFVGVIRQHPTTYSSEQSWHCYLLPPPPFVREPRHWDNNRRPEITAYGVVAGDVGSHVCISVEGVGTYCLDTLSDTWSLVGEWTLPFRGKVEYDPELKLWFGLSADDDTNSLAADDLSHMDSSQSQSQPQLVLGPWKEFNPPKEWKECKEPQFVSLGAGRFCIARFFQAAAAAASNNTDDAGLTGDDDGFAVLTGVEVNSRGKGGTQDVHQLLQMTPHISKRVNSTSIEALF